jgi:hypothetical protein
MAKNTRSRDDSVAQVAEEAMPGWKVVRETSLEEATTFADAPGNDAASAADAVMPSLDQLKAKYLGARRDDADAVRPDYTEADAADTALVEMEAGPLKKTVAVSRSKKKVLWSQG